MEQALYSSCKCQPATWPATWTTVLNFTPLCTYAPHPHASGDDCAQGNESTQAMQKGHSSTKSASPHVIYTQYISPGSGLATYGKSCKIVGVIRTRQTAGQDHCWSSGGIWSCGTSGRTRAPFEVADHQMLPKVEDLRDGHCCPNESLLFAKSCSLTLEREEQLGGLQARKLLHLYVTKSCHLPCSKTCLRQYVWNSCNMADFVTISGGGWELYFAVVAAISMWIKGSWQDICNNPIEPTMPFAVKLAMFQWTHILSMWLRELK